MSSDLRAGVWEWLGRWLAIREPLSLAQRILLGVVPVVAILAIWSLITAGQPDDRWFVSALILPSPLEVVTSFKRLWFEAELSRSVLASAMRVVGGFAVALAIAFPLGVAMGSFSKVRALFEPLTVFGSYLPIPTLVPLTMSLFGIDEQQKIMFLALAFVIFLLPMFFKAVADVDDVYLETAQTLGASKWQLVRRVLLGVALARIYDAMRQGFGVGWTYIILAEMVAADRGLGHIIISAQRRAHPEQVYLVLLVIVVIAYGVDQAWLRLGKYLFPYRELA